jgi:tRNA pseudouridine38-40 synthase
MRIALGVEYDGSSFHGWQTQANAISVQSTLEKALGFVANHTVRVFCAGRTDVAVHATHQVVHFDTDVERTMRSWIFGANSNLPSSVRVHWAQAVPDTFDARRSALQRHYRYILYNSAIRPALYRHHVSWLPGKLSLEEMINASSYWLGEHDFSAFRASQCQSKSPIRKIHDIKIKQKGEYFTFDFIANAFLHHMVRNMVGVLTKIGTCQKKVDWAKEVLESRDRRLAGVTAKPEGLYLIDVLYPAHFGLPQGGKGPPFMPN